MFNGLTFALGPCKEKSKIKKLIQDNDGILLRNNAIKTNETYQLMPPNTKLPLGFNGDAYSTDLIIDSVNNGKFADVDDYKLSYQDSTYSHNTRTLYTQTEDNKLMEFIRKEIAKDPSLKPMGRRIYEIAEHKNILNRSWQSMQTRFRDHLAKKFDQKRRTPNPLMIESVSNSGVVEEDNTEKENFDASNTSGESACTQDSLGILTQHSGSSSQKDSEGFSTGTPMDVFTQLGAQTAESVLKASKEKTNKNLQKERLSALKEQLSSGEDHETPPFSTSGSRTPTSPQDRACPNYSFNTQQQYDDSQVDDNDGDEYNNSPKSKGKLKKKESSSAKKKGESSTKKAKIKVKLTEKTDKEEAVDDDSDNNDDNEDEDASVGSVSSGTNKVKMTEQELIALQTQEYFVAENRAVEKKNRLSSKQKRKNKRKLMKTIEEQTEVEENNNNDEVDVDIVNEEASDGCIEKHDNVDNNNNNNNNNDNNNKEDNDDDDDDDDDDAATELEDISSFDKSQESKKSAKLSSQESRKRKRVEKQELDEEKNSDDEDRSESKSNNRNKKRKKSKANNHKNKSPVRSKRKSSNRNRKKSKTNGNNNKRKSTKRKKPGSDEEDDMENRIESTRGLEDAFDIIKTLCKKYKKSMRSIVRILYQCNGEVDLVEAVLNKRLRFPEANDDIDQALIWASPYLLAQNEKFVTLDAEDIVSAWCETLERKIKAYKDYKKYVTNSICEEQENEMNQLIKDWKLFKPVVNNYLRAHGIIQTRARCRFLCPELMSQNKK